MIRRPLSPSLPRLLSPGERAVIPSLRSTIAGITIVEAVTAMAITAIISAAAIGSLLTAQALAARARLMTNARVVVQRNIDTALSIPFSGINPPEILQVTNGAWEIYEETFDSDASASPTPTPSPTPSPGPSPAPTPAPNTTVALNSEGDPIVLGTLTRLVTDLPSGQLPNDVPGVIIRKVTFRIQYTYLNRSYQYEMTTLRAQDIQ